MLSKDGIAYEARGTGTPLVFVAGLGGLGAYWRHQVDVFAARHKTVTFDHRGLGGSVKTPPPYTIELLAADTELGESSIGRFVLSRENTIVAGGRVRTVVGRARGAVLDSFSWHIKIKATGCPTAYACSSCRRDSSGH